jgi:hypothetical protein
MAIQNYPKELDMVNAMLRVREGSNSFMEYFLKACLHADDENYELLRYVLRILSKKFPVSMADLLAEERDRESAQ